MKHFIQLLLISFALIDSEAFNLIRPMSTRHQLSPKCLSSGLVLPSNVHNKHRNNHFIEKSRIHTAYNLSFNPQEDSDNKSEDAAASVPPSTVSMSTSSTPKVGTSASSSTSTTTYPINAPSPLLLAGSMVSAIAAIGSIFDLTSSTQTPPSLGYPITASIAVVGVPLCFFLFYASIKKGIAETEADDAEFYKKNPRY